MIATRNPTSATRSSGALSQHVFFSQLRFSSLSEDFYYRPSLSQGILLVKIISSFHF